MNILTEGKPLKKTAQATESLRQLVQEVGPDAKLPTYLDLLERLAVSRTTLNAALDELESQRVIYRRHGVGIFSGPSKRNHSVALLCNPRYFQGKTHSPFWDILLEGARERALMDDFSCEVHFCKFQDFDMLPFSDNLLNLLQRGQLQGVISVGMNRAAYLWLKQRGIHQVSFGGPGAWYVGLDTGLLIQQGVQALAEHGCRRLAFLSPILPFKNYGAHPEELEVKTEIFRMSLAHHHLPFERERVATLLNLLSGEEMTTLSNQEQGYQAVHQIFSALPEIPDGVLFTDDVMAKGGMVALQELKIQPGRDIQVVTHANRGTTVLAPYVDVLTRLEIDPAEIVNSLFSTIRDLLEGEQPKGYALGSDGTSMNKRILPTLRRPIHLAL